ncbi:MAG: hypothetical protein R6U41_10415, partial [Desulfosalsimonas sp.]|uniref:hypothetical protein n=1 Tax=Desulfosalsimonas sp. TaxID=3073848 RepID=UPI0039705084
NPNIEIRNPKQIRISNVQMIKTNSLKQDVSVIDAFRVLVIVSDFELRISDFLNENLVFVQALFINKFTAGGNCFDLVSNNLFFLSIFFIVLKLLCIRKYGDKIKNFSSLSVRIQPDSLLHAAREHG